MMTRVDELTEELLRKEFADAYSAPPKYESVSRVGIVVIHSEGQT